MNLNMKAPCKNCPFLKEGAIDLRPGRLEGIIADLKADDYSNFTCHKTTHKRGVEPSMCMGSAVYMMKADRPSVALRFALASRMIELNDLKEHYNAIIEPLETA